MQLETIQTHTQHYSFKLPQPLIETKEDDPTDLGLIHPEGLLDDGLPNQAVERVHDMPERTTRSGKTYIASLKTIVVEKVDTQYQLADIFTKALPRDAFRHLRKTIIGW